MATKPKTKAKAKKKSGGKTIQLNKDQMAILDIIDYISKRELPFGQDIKYKNDTFIIEDAENDRNGTRVSVWMYREIPSVTTVVPVEKTVPGKKIISS